jgi:hypothetical protein
MSIIPIDPMANQIFSVKLAGQDCIIEIRQKRTGVFVDLTVNTVKILTGCIALDRVNLISDDYRGFIGSLQFQDMQGKSNPDYSGFGTRWVLRYA